MSRPAPLAGDHGVSAGLAPSAPASFGSLPPPAHSLPDLCTVSEVLQGADELLLAGRRATARTWPTGFPLLDTYLAGGLRAGELGLIGGPAGLGKTTLLLQMARNTAAAGGSCVLLSYEHDVTTLLERLVALEAGALLGVDGPPVRRVRQALEASGRTPGTLRSALAGVPGGVEAIDALATYSDRLLLHRSHGSATDLAAIRRVVDATIARTGRQPLVAVDYLQKVHVPEGGPEDERVTTIVEGLKDLALEREVPVLAIAVADRAGLAEGRRLRLHHLRGSSALAYEADVVLVLNDKFDVVARHHLVYDPSGAQRHRGYVVLSLEKNRSGVDHVDLQLRKRFEASRFDVDAEPVTEQLVDERVFTE